MRNRIGVVTRKEAEKEGFRLPRATKTDPWIELLRKSAKARKNLYNRAKRLMKKLASKDQYPDVAVVRGLMELARKR